MTEEKQREVFECLIRVYNFSGPEIACHMAGTPGGSRPDRKTINHIRKGRIRFATYKDRLVVAMNRALRKRGSGDRIPAGVFDTEDGYGVVPVGPDGGQACQ